MSYRHIYSVSYQFQRPDGSYGYGKQEVTISKPFPDIQSIKAATQSILGLQPQLRDVVIIDYKFLRRERVDG